MHPKLAFTPQQSWKKTRLIKRVRRPASHSAIQEGPSQVWQEGLTDGEIEKEGKSSDLKVGPHLLWRFCLSQRSLRDESTPRRRETRWVLLQQACNSGPTAERACLQQEGRRCRSFWAKDRDWSCWENHRRPGERSGDWRPMLRKAQD